MFCSGTATVRLPGGRGRVSGGSQRRSAGDKEIYTRMYLLTHKVEKPLIFHFIVIHKNLRLIALNDWIARTEMMSVLL